jgi:hypothetical protein
MARRSDVNRRPAGRPRSVRPAGQRSTLSLRITAELFEQLNKEAKAKGKTLSAVAETRLEFAGRDERRLDQALELVYGRQLAGLLTLFGHVMREVGRSAGFSSTYTLEGAENWMTNPYAYGQVAKAANLIFKRFRPEGDPAPPPYMKGKPFGPDGIDLERAARILGEGAARAYLEAVADPEEAISADLKRIGTEVGQQLGPDVVERIRQNIDAPARQSVRQTQADE